MSPYFSIIVPVYNSSQYLNRCIDSILNQTYHDFELILVDDGSTDDSGNICDIYAQKDKRIRVFHQSNGGVSSARNKGIKEACGKYIAFVDSDDYLSQDKLEKYIVFCKEEPDIIIGNKNVPYKLKYNKHIIGINDLPHICNVGVVWNSLFYTDHLKQHNITFDENIWHGEDSLFILFCFFYANHIMFVDSYGYHYETGHKQGLNIKYQLWEKEYYTYDKLREMRMKISKRLYLNNNYTKFRISESIRIIKSIFINNHPQKYSEILDILKKISHETEKGCNHNLKNRSDKIIFISLKNNFYFFLYLYMKYIWYYKNKQFIKSITE